MFPDGMHYLRGLFHPGPSANDSKHRLLFQGMASSIEEIIFWTGWIFTPCNSYPVPPRPLAIYFLALPVRALPAPPRPAPPRPFPPFPIPPLPPACPRACRWPRWRRRRSRSPMRVRHMERDMARDNTWSSACSPAPLSVLCRLFSILSLALCPRAA